MKRYLNLLLATFALVAFVGCDKDENRVIYEGGTSPVLTASRTNTIPLSFATQGAEAIKFNWTNPNYQFNTGISSQNVSYNLEIDTTGANFTNPNKKVVTFSNDLTSTYTQAQFNDFLLSQLNLAPGLPHNTDIRLVSSINGSAVKMPSNVLKLTGVVPFAIPPKVEPPTARTLWVTGDAFASGYANPLTGTDATTQKFTQVGNTNVYELTVAMKGGGAYKLIQEQGNWGTQYHMLAGGTWEGGDFEKKDSDPGFPGAPSAGNYKITVDFQRGKYTVVKL